MQEKNKNNYASPLLRRTGFFHGGYYLLTGLWSLVSISSFQAVTGSKTDIWLVKTIGLLLTVSGLVFLYSAARRSFPVETVILAIGTALALAFIEITYGSVGHISAVNLLDAVLEVFLAGLWITGVWKQREGRIS
jgi:cytochrome b subunit of formate dehydrogenase